MSRQSEMMQAFHGAREQRDRDREREALGYATEGAEFDEARPAPRLKDFMKATAAPPEGVCAHGFYAVECFDDGCHPEPVKLRPSERKAWNRSVSALARDRGIYGDVMAVWEQVTRLREAGMSPATVIAYLSGGRGALADA